MPHYCILLPFVLEEDTNDAPQIENAPCMWLMLRNAHYFS